MCVESSDKTEALTAQLAVTKAELIASNSLETIDRELVRAKHQPYIFGPGEEVNPIRFEMLLYLATHSRLDGQLYIPTSIKYRALRDDLISDEQWQGKQKLMQKAMLPRLIAIPNRLIQTMESDLENKLQRVSQRIEKGDNHNVILRNRSGKTKWRLPSSGYKNMLNNPFFELIKPINIAEVLRFLDQERLSLLF